jgi:hypothetical protein
LKAYFAGQPWEGGRNADDFINEATQHPSADARVRIGVAWTKRSGLRFIAPYLRTVRDAGGRLELITGLSAGGATRQGLELALEIFDDVYVVFDNSGPTFHPKIYLYRDGDDSRALVGSHNLTAGGLFRNIEAGLEVVSESADDFELFDDIEDWLDDLIADTAMAAKLDSVLLEELVENPRFRIGDEDLPAGGAGSTDDAANAEPAFGPFTKSARKRRFAEKIATAVRVTPAIAAAIAEADETRDEEPTLLYIWSKQLSRSDALRPNPGSSPTAVLRLGKSGWDIDKETFFREDFFGELSWALVSEVKGKYVCTVDFDCVVDGVSIGIHTLIVDFVASRVSSQNNVPTVLHWGTLSPAIRDVDHIGSWVVLRALSDGRFSLEIKAEPAFGETP